MTGRAIEYHHLSGRDVDPDEALGAGPARRRDPCAVRRPCQSTEGVERIGQRRHARGRVDEPESSRRFGGWIHDRQGSAVRRPAGVATTDEGRLARRYIEHDRACIAIDRQPVAVVRPGDGLEPDARLMEGDLRGGAIGTGQIDVPAADVCHQPGPEWIRLTMTAQCQREEDPDDHRENGQGDPGGPICRHRTGVREPHAPGGTLSGHGRQVRDLAQGSRGGQRSPLFECRLEQVVGQPVGAVHRRSTSRARSSERRALKSRDLTVLLGTPRRAPISSSDRWSKW